MRYPAKISIALVGAVALAWPIYSSMHEEHEDDDENEAEQVLAREAFRITQLQDENQQILPGSWAKAWKQKQGMPFLADAWAEFPNVPGTPGLLPWVSIGPGSVGGRVRGILIDPANPNHLWVSGVTGGVWESIDGGEHWTTNTDFNGNINVSHLAMDPTNPKIIYLATGGETLTGNGISLSDDGGKKWVHLLSTQNAGFVAVNRLAISSNGAILAGTTTGLFRSDNHGVSWVQVISGADVYDVHFHPTDPSKALCSGRAGNIYHSENGGLTWSRSDFPVRPPGTGTIKIAYSKSNPLIVYANTLTETQAGQLYRSTDGGLSFLPTGPCCTGVLWWANVLWVDPVNPDRVIYGGGTIYRSFDRGVTRVFAQGHHEDTQIIVSDPGYDGVTNRKVWLGSDGGLDRTDNILNVPNPIPPYGQSWVNWTNMNNGLEITQCLGADGNEESGVIVLGTQDNGNLQYNGSEWGGIMYSDGGYCAADQNDPRYFYLETMWLSLYRSSNGGKSAQFIGYNIPHNCNGFPCANFTAPFVLDPNDSNVLLAGGYPLWKSSNVREEDPHAIRWKEIKPATGSFISAIAVKKNNSDVMWVGHLNGEIYSTQNGTGKTPVWTKMSAGLPQRYCSHLTISGDVVYATFGGFSHGNIWRYAEGAWSDISQGLPALPIYTVVVSPFNPQYVYIGTEQGVFGSGNYGNSWSSGNRGPADVAVFVLFWIKGHLHAGTFGRGMSRIGPATH